MFSLPFFEVFMAEKRKRTRTQKPKKNLEQQMKSSSKKKKRTSKETVDYNRLVSSGSTLLNCACTDSPHGAFQQGKFVNIVGDSSSGKTLLALTLFAEANLDEKYDNYLFVYDDVEFGCEFDKEKICGKEAAKRIQPPAKDKEGEDDPSGTVQDFHYNIRKLLKGDKPFIYILDSYDALDTEEDEKKLEEQMKAKEEGKQAKGSYGTSKAIGSSSLFRNIKKALKKTNSILIVISQTRTNINAGLFSPSKTRSGGKALDFYATHIMWMAIIKPIDIERNKIKRQIGVETKVNVTKNRLTGKKRAIDFTIYYDLGIDDIKANIKFLLDVKWWSKKKQKIVAEELGLVETEKVLIREIEKNNLESKLRDIVGEAWKEVEESVKLNRKSRY